MEQIINEELREVAQQLDSDAEKSANEALSPDGQDPETTDSLYWLQEKQSETKGENSVNADGNRQKGLLPNVNINFASKVWSKSVYSGLHNLMSCRQCTTSTRRRNVGKQRRFRHSIFANAPRTAYAR